MTNLEHYLQDGANYQARTVLMIVQKFNINNEPGEQNPMNLAEPKIARWENCREQGYVISLRSLNRKKQLNIAFFEHRNSDNICAVKWEQVTTNAPTIDTAKFGDVYKDKYDTSFDVGCHEFVKMADWITEQLFNFWIAPENTNSQKGESTPVGLVESLGSL